MYFIVFYFFLKIYDGTSLSSPLRGSYCGIKSPTAIVSNGQSLTVHLSSKYEYSYLLRGINFAAHYSVYDNGLFICIIIIIFKQFQFQFI